MLRPFPLLGAPAAAGPEAAAQRPAHQTCPEDHEVSASAQGKKHVTAVLLANPQHRVCYEVTNIQVEKPQHLHANLCAEMLITHSVLSGQGTIKQERNRLFIIKFKQQCVKVLESWFLVISKHGGHKYYLSLLWVVNLECSGDRAVFISTGLPKVLHQSWDGHGGAGGGFYSLRFKWIDAFICPCGEIRLQQIVADICIHHIKTMTSA